jgi:steroid 5-alpha reductase family enzyme
MVAPGKRQLMMGKARSLFIVFVAYLLSLLCGYFTAEWLQQLGYGFLWALAGADLVCTLVVFAFTYAFKNTSIYDPYWSVIPPFIALYSMESWDTRSALVLAVVWLWGLRLTWNWVRRWRGMQDIDWRYRDYEKRTGKWFWLVSFFGLQLVPTIVVFLACLPLVVSLKFAEADFGVFGMTGVALAVVAVWLAWKADQELWAFLKNKREKLGAKGLWAIWRFPNYIGEVLFWWGLFLIGIEAAPSHWQILIGPAVMTALFHFISMPLMEERHRLKRPEYYRELLLRPRWIPAFRSSVKDKC